MAFFLRQWGGSNAQDAVRSKPSTATTATTKATPSFSTLDRQVTAVTLESFDSLLMSFDNDNRGIRGAKPPRGSSSNSSTCVNSNNNNNTSNNEIRSDASTTSSTMTDADEEIQAVMARLDVAQCRKLTLVGAERDDQTVIMPPNGEFQVLHNPLQVSALSEIMREAPSLVCLELYNMELVGHSESFVDFANAIEYQGKLQALSLEHCRLGKNSRNKRRLATTDNKETPLDSVVKALCHNLYIRDLTLVADESQSLGRLSATTLGLLGSSQSLHTLRLCNMGMSDDETSALAHALKENNALRNLQVSFSMGHIGSTAMISMLTHNVSVEKLDIVLEQVEDEDATLQLARAMQSSKSLVDFDLSFSDDLPLTSTFQQVYYELKEWKEVAEEMAWKSTSLSNCPFIQLLERTLEYCLTGCYTGSSSSYKTL